MTPVVSREEWLEERHRLLEKEKELTKARDALNAARRELPRVKVEEDYVFDGPEGTVPFLSLFGDKRQLVIYHLMYAPEWETPCKSCSFWADHFDGMRPHLAARDTQLVAVSRAPIDKIEATKARMGWKFPWYSSGDGPFNYDYRVSFPPDTPIFYNYEQWTMSSTDMPGISTFIRDEAGNVFHTYSAYARGIDAMNGTYQYLDLTPLGRHEEGLSYPMEWVRLHDEY